jgi:hypothetical protein
MQSINGSLHGIGHFERCIASHDLTAIRIWSRDLGNACSINYFMAVFLLLNSVFLIFFSMFFFSNYPHLLWLKQHYILVSHPCKDVTFNFGWNYFFEFWALSLVLSPATGFRQWVQSARLVLPWHENPDGFWLSFLKLAMVLWSGESPLISHISSILRPFFLAF